MNAPPCDCNCHIPGNVVAHRPWNCLCPGRFFCVRVSGLPFAEVSQLVMQYGRRVTVSPECDRASHLAMVADREFFASLHLVGFQNDGAGGQLELRDCPLCGSTLAR